MASLFNGKSRDIGLLILRLGIGTMFIYHGLPKLLDGPSYWKHLGGAMSFFGIGFAPAFWGFLAAFSVCFGGISLILGVLFRPFCVILTLIMVVAAAIHLRMGHGLTQASQTIELGIVFIALFFMGPGGFVMKK